MAPRPPFLFWHVRGIFPSAVLLLLFCAGCNQHPATPAPIPEQVRTPSSIGQGHPANGEVWRYSYEILNTFPHDRTAFTQGLVFLDGKLIESTGLKGQSTLREVNLLSGRVLRQVPVPDRYFAEGLAVLGGKAYQLTWQAQKGFVYDEATFRLEHEFSYTGEGWGLATDGHSLILSDGTSQIRFLDPATFKVERTIRVTVRGQSVDQLNELEYIQGEIFANVWRTDYVVRIDPANGAVTGVIDFAGLLPPADHDANTGVLNGIAYDNANDRLFVTGKFWPRLFQVRLQRVP
ncbi:MAG TPA: glutaminyl-peptide cyclotransferase [Candidatus Saccharimonadales bacterium]|nr:glutaminyl-peptide cyclotransferase [Candidatus Saccharimonadales bacterium]